MTNNKNTTEQENELLDQIDLEEEARSGRPPRPARRYRLRIDDRKYVVDDAVVTGRALLELASRTPVDGYVLIQRVRGRCAEVVTPNEEVDLSLPGIERFVTRPVGTDELVVLVFAPRAVEPKVFTWPAAKLVGEAAKEAAAAFGYEAGTPGLQKGGVALDNRKTLQAAGVEQGDELELFDTGGGV